MSGLSRDARHRAGEHELAALLAALRPELHHVVGGPDRIEVVLDDEHRVAAVAQAEEQREQAVHVARMQTDRRLVEHVERVDETRAERVGEADALRLAAGERARGAIQREVVEPDVAEEANAIPRLLEDVRGDLLLERRRARARRATRVSALMGRSLTSAMLRPAIFTCSASGWSLVPWQVGHSCAVWYCRRKTRMYCL